MKQIQSFEDYLNQYELSKSNPADYWSKVAKNLDWFSTWKSVTSGDFSSTNVKWFEEATTNLAHNCLDRHLIDQPEKTAPKAKTNNG